MITKYIIHLAKNQFCNCFSDSDLVTNIRFAVESGFRILSVQAV